MKICGCRKIKNRLGDTLEIDLVRVYLYPDKTRNIFIAKYNGVGEAEIDLREEILQIKILCI
jgi:hypothetical protein